jgi:hypothetical protein
LSATGAGFLTQTIEHSEWNLFRNALSGLEAGAPDVFADGFCLDRARSAFSQSEPNMSITRSAALSARPVSRDNKVTRLLSPRCLVAAAIAEAATAVLILHAAGQGTYELARLVVAGSVPVMALWCVVRTWEMMRRPGA